MPKTTLTVVLPNISGDPNDVNSKYIFVPEATVTFHSELISLVHPYYNDREKKWEKDYSVIILTNVLQPIIVKESVSAIEALMENQPYLPVSDGSGGSLSGGSSGSGFSGSGSGDPTSSTDFKGSLSTTFNGACQANTTATYYHTGSGTLPAAGNQVFINSNHSTAMADGYYGIAASGNTATHSMRVVAGYVASGWPIACNDLEEVPEP